jgi:hypothetical protein
MVMFNTSGPELEPSVGVEELVDRIRNIEADAARYRWLRDRGFDFTEFEDLKGEELDRAIDSRRQSCSDSDSILFGVFLGVPVGEVDEFVARLRSLEEDATRYRWIREGHAIE